MSRRRRLFPAVAATAAALALACTPRAEGPDADLGTPIPDAEVAGVYADLESHDAARIERALARIRGPGAEGEDAPRGDRRFVAVLIESLRLAHLDERESQAYNARVVALERLAGERFGGDWFRWSEWYEGTALEPPPGFLDFKGRLLARVHPGFPAFLSSEHPSRLRPELIRWGGVAPGGIPALDEPTAVAAADIEGLAADDAVFGLRIGDAARAYPLRILDWHELVNDRVGGEAVTLTYCTLCGSALAYRAGERTFETSGLLYRSNKLMFDHQTRTLWSQLEGRPVLGPLADRDLQLEVLPGVVTTWAAWRAQHPDTTVVSFATGHERDYSVGMPYGGYFASQKLMFPAGTRDERLPAKAQVYGIVQGGHARAWPLAGLVAQRVVNDDFAGGGLVLVATRGAVDLEGTAPHTGPVAYRAGAEVRAYRAGGERFGPGDAPDRVLDARDRPWRVTEAALVGPEGERAERVAGGIAYWFAWHAFHPGTELAEALIEETDDP